MRIFLAFLAAVFASPLLAQDASNTGVDTAQVYADLVTEVCLPVTRGDIDFTNTTPDENDALIEGFDMAAGIDGEIHGRFGRQGASVLNRSIMGHRAVGDDMIVLAIGGMLPGCKMILLRPEGETLANGVAEALKKTEMGWRELPFAETRPGMTVSKRSFIARDDGNAYLLNIIIPPIPDSQLRLMATINLIPAQVEIPEGY